VCRWFLSFFSITDYLLDGAFLDASFDFFWLLDYWWRLLCLLRFFVASDYEMIISFLFSSFSPLITLSLMIDFRWLFSAFIFISLDCVFFFLDYFSFLLSFLAFADYASDGAGWYGDWGCEGISIISDFSLDIISLHDIFRCFSFHFLRRIDVSLTFRLILLSLFLRFFFFFFFFFIFISLIADYLSLLMIISRVDWFLHYEVVALLDCADWWWLFHGDVSRRYQETCW